MKRDEIWKPCIGWEGLYEVSDLGRVRGMKSQKILKAGRNSSGYSYVWLSRGRGNNKGATVHRLVAEAHIPNPLNLPVVMHGEDNKEDNSVHNLKWGTQGENLLSRKKRTHCKRGHEYTEDNLGKRKDGGRTCKACRRLKYREWE